MKQTFSKMLFTTNSVMQTAKLHDLSAVQHLKMAAV